MTLAKILSLLSFSVKQHSEVKEARAGTAKGREGPCRQEADRARPGKASLMKEGLCRPAWSCVLCSYDPFSVLVFLPFS